MSKAETVIYVENDVFYAAIVEYKKVCKEAEENGKPRPQIPTYIAKCIMEIAKNVANKPCYNRYPYKDLMIADAVENCVKYFHNFDVNRPEKNPFGYFTQYCGYAFHRRIWEEKTEFYARCKLIQQSGTMDDDIKAHMEENGEDAIQVALMYDNINEFIAKYEEALKKRKGKKEKKAKKSTEKQ
jgi:hypothetical protein